MAASQTIERNRVEGHESDRGRALAALWADRRLGCAAAVALAAAFGLGTVWLTPRGPITTGEALATLGVALAIGLAAGLITASRWVLLVAPLVFVAVLESVRLGMVGPTVDAPTFGSFYGYAALVLGRGVHTLLAVVPMLVGATYGIWAARRWAGAGRGIGRPGAALAIFATIGLAVLAVYVARPATTAPIPGPDGEPLEGSVAELVTIPIGGHDQTLMIRGRSTDNPVLLYLAGGPGGTDLGAVRADTTLEQDFVVAVWDQRGAGKSYRALDPTDTFTVDQMVADTFEVTDYLRERFDVERIYIVGQSWGSTLGVLAATETPKRYTAFVGVGQMVSQRASDVMFWEDTLAWAESTDNQGLAEQLRANGPPPYEDLNHYDPVVGYEHDWNSYPELDLSNEMPGILFVPEYTFMDRVNAFRGFLDTAATLYPQLQDIDFRQDVAALEIPFYMVQGEHEARGRAVLADEWFDMVAAPHKERVVLEGAGHRAHFDRPAEFARLMSEVRTEAP